MATARLAVQWFAVVALSAGGLSAQDLAGLQGSRLRVKTLSQEVFIGTCAGEDEKTITIGGATEGGLERVDRRNIVAVDVSRGHQRHTLEGLLGGALTWGAIVGLYAAFDTLDESGVGEPSFIWGTIAAGGVVGTLVKTERWERVPQGTLSMRLSPLRRGVQAQVTVTF
jgi:hypothetical protein